MYHTHRDDEYDCQFFCCQVKAEEEEEQKKGENAFYLFQGN